MQKQKSKRRLEQLARLQEQNGGLGATAAALSFSSPPSSPLRGSKLDIALSWWVCGLEMV